MVKSVLILFVSIVFIYLIEGIAQFVNPYHSVIPYSIVLMLLLPYFASLAGNYWFSSWVFILYGGIGMLVFVASYLSDPQLGLRLYEYINLVGELLVWSVATLLVMWMCVRKGRESYRQKNPDND